MIATVWVLAFAVSCPLLFGFNTTGEVASFRGHPPVAGIFLILFFILIETHRVIIAPAQILHRNKWMIVSEYSIIPTTVYLYIMFLHCSPSINQ